MRTPTLPELDGEMLAQLEDIAGRVARGETSVEDGDAEIVALRAAHDAAVAVVIEDGARKRRKQRWALAAVIVVIVVVFGVKLYPLFR